MDLQEKGHRRIRERLGEDPTHLPQRCGVFGCSRPTQRAARQGLSPDTCRFHIQRAARHGSPWAPSLKAADLRPYVKVALRIIRDLRELPQVAHTHQRLQAVLDSAGGVLPAHRVKHRSQRVKARMCFARLHKAGVRAERLLAIHMGVCAAIEDDRMAHRGSDEYRIVQVAKAAHRLASGMNKRLDLGTERPEFWHFYPRSSGRVLRVIGRDIEEAIGGPLGGETLEELRERKAQRYGPHPTRLLTWVPPWQRYRAGAA